MATIYTVHYELDTDENDTMEVLAVSEERALEHAAGILEQEHEDSLLLVCEVVGSHEE